MRPTVPGSAQPNYQRARRDRSRTDCVALRANDRSTSRQVDFDGQSFLLDFLSTCQTTNESQIHQVIVLQFTIHFSLDTLHCVKKKIRNKHIRYNRERDATEYRGHPERWAVATVCCVLCFCLPIDPIKTKRKKKTSPRVQNCGGGTGPTGSNSN